MAAIIPSIAPSANWLSTPTLIQSDCLSYLSPMDLLRASGVCREFNNMCNSEIIWKVFTKPSLETIHFVTSPVFLSYLSPIDLSRTSKVCRESNKICSAMCKSEIIWKAHAKLLRVHLQGTEKFEEIKSKCIEKEREINSLKNEQKQLSFSFTKHMREALDIQEDERAPYNEFLKFIKIWFSSRTAATLHVTNWKKFLIQVHPDKNFGFEENASILFRLLQDIRDLQTCSKNLRTLNF